MFDFPGWVYWIYFGRYLIAAALIGAGLFWFVTWLF